MPERFSICFVGVRGGAICLCGEQRNVRIRRSNLAVRTSVSFDCSASYQPPLSCRWPLSEGWQTSHNIVGDDIIQSVRTRSCRPLVSISVAGRLGDPVSGGHSQRNEVTCPNVGWGHQFHIKPIIHHPWPTDAPSKLAQSSRGSGNLVRIRPSHTDRHNGGTRGR